MASALTTGPRRRDRLRRSGLVAAASAILLALGAVVPVPPGRVAGANDEVRVLMGAPATLDPAAAGDHASARVIAQLHESLTAIDPGLSVQPALAASWDVLDGGRRIVFHLRPNVTFSDGSPISGDDVVRSWLRIIDPGRPSPLASLMLDVVGAADYLRGDGRDPSGVGIRASGRDVEVELVRPAADFVAIVAGPTFAIVPPGLATTPQAAVGGFVGSGAYVLDDVEPGQLRLRANDHYWAGRPGIGTVLLVNDLGGRSTVDAYVDEVVDYTPIPGSDAAWIRYDEVLGPDLRFETVPSVDYLGFDTSRPPFDDVRVRQAFAAAVNWRRIVELADPATALPATSLVPPGIPGRSERDFLPQHDPDAARDALAEAGYPGGAGFPDIAFVGAGGGYAEAVLAEVERELGITISYESMDFETYIQRLERDPPPIWSLGWVADYPGANDFLGVLLGSDEANNYGRWSSPEFDEALRDALSSGDPEDAVAAFERAQAVVQREVPVVPLSYGSGWALAREGLLGAHQGGLGIVRLAGLAWDEAR